ncbi:T9SS type A sorting domain-containing protein, partial [bacterium]|nr:T9SS type A sorting domain-containing protein [bacterium]
TVTLTATNANGSDSHTMTNYITVNAIPTVVATGTASICAGESTIISASGATNYSWSKGAGTSATVTVSPRSTTTYTVTGTTNGCANTDQVIVTVNPSPTVIATGTSSICAGESTTISASGATNYSWNNGAGTSATVTVSPASTTTYTVTGITNGCTNTDQVIVTVNPSPTVTATGTTSICTGESTTISASGATSYSWNNGAGISASAIVSPTSTTTYTVTGTTNGCTNTDQVTVSVSPVSVISVGTVSNPTTCGTATGSIQVNGSGAGIVSWTGTSSGSSNGISLPYTISGLATGTYSITFMSSSMCESNTISQSLSDPTPPTTPVITPNGPTTFCIGGTVTLTSSYATGNTWSNSTNGSTLVVTNSGTYGVVYTDPSGCSAASAPITITVNTSPTVIATGTATICAGEPTLISASGASSYAWNNGAGTNATVTVSPTSTTTYTVTGTTNGCTGTDQVTVTTTPVSSSNADVEICEGSSYSILGSTYTVSGTYTDVATNAAGCDSTVTTNLTVSPNPTVVITPATIDTLCVTSSPITLIGTPTGGTFSGTGVTGNIFSPAIGAGTYTITYSYTDGNGCIGETNVIAIVEECPNSVSEVGLIGVNLFPNPNEGVFMISGLAVGTEYEIFDDRGRLVSTGVTESEEEEVQLLNVQTGIYYLYATQKGEKGSLKFLITK